MDTDVEWIWVPTPEAEKYRLMSERARIRYAKYNSKRPDRPNGHIPLSERDFIVWDGEGPRDTGYSLLGNSEGEEICYPTLSTADCLDLFLSSALAHPGAIHTSFAFGYDTSCILRDLSWRHLSALHTHNRTVWQEYELQHIPRKWLAVKRGHQRIKIYDVFGFFQSSLVEALTEWKIGPFAQTDDAGNSVTMTQVPSVHALSKMPESEVVRIFKSLRNIFQWKDIESIRLYMRLELKYTKMMLEQLRTTFLDAGYLPRSWHGPAALAREAFRKHDVYSAIATLPVEVQIASQYAFAGGRFEPFFAGHANQPVYVADINSAYPWYATRLPNLQRGRWRHGSNYEPGKYAIYYVEYAAQPDPYRPYPLFHRDSSLNIVYPHRTSGWYWAPETELIANDRNAVIREAWVFDEMDTSDRPFTWITEYYRRRQVLKRIGNPAQFTFKLIINSCYGCLAQRAGWDRKHRQPPRTHCLGYAGYITSACRAAVYRQACLLGNDLVSIDTDGITSLRPFDLESSDELGGWKLSTYDEGVFWQSGIYCLRQGDKWPANKMRGIPRGSYTPADLLEHMRTMEPLKLTRQTFIGYGLALNGMRELNNTWQEEYPEYVFGGTGKRQHVMPHGKCTSACHGEHHRLALPPFSVPPVGPCESQPHTLPWITRDRRKNFLNDFTLYGEEEYYEERRYADAY